MPLVKPAETSTLVMSQPCRALNPTAGGRELLSPKVPEVSSRPLSPLIWLAKKLFAALLVPDSCFNELVVGPNSIWSPVLFGSPSTALTKRRAFTDPEGGAQKPTTEAGLGAGPPAVANELPTKSERFRWCNEGLP